MLKKALLSLGLYAAALGLVVPALAGSETLALRHSDLLTRAESAMHTGQFEKAIALQERALGGGLSDSQKVIAYNNLCISYHMVAEMEKAIEACSNAIHLKPDFWRAYNNRANVFYDLDDFYAAEQDYIRAIQINPGSEVLEQNLGLVRQLQASAN